MTSRKLLLSIGLGLVGLYLADAQASEQPENPYSCSSATKLGYTLKWSGAQKGSSSSQRSGKFWDFVGESINFYLQTRFRKDIGELTLIHPATEIDYSPDNQFTLDFGAKAKGENNGRFQLNTPWYEGRTQEQAGQVSIITKTLFPTDEPCLQGYGELTFIDENGEAINVELVFALDVAGRKYRP